VRRGLAGALAALVFGTAATASAARPLRLAAYYPWFPEGWSYVGLDPFTHFQPSLGYYDAGDPRVIQAQIRAMKYGNIQAATYSWWGQRTPADLRFPAHLALATGTGFRWAVYYEPEGYGDPSVDDIRADLQYIRDSFATARSYLRIGGRFVVFVYGDAADGAGCGVAERWAEANTVNAYVVLRAFAAFRACPHQPAGWHTYSADRYEYSLRGYSYSISPGFFFAADQRPRRVRDLHRWTGSIRRMVRSKAPFQLVISFNEWGEGTAVESARQWESPSGYGEYLDALHAVR
jgi:Glycosyl hydrolase family 99